MANSVDINAIHYAVSQARFLAEFYGDNTRGPDAHDRYKAYLHTATEAEKALSQLSRVWSNFCFYERQRGEAYDRYVTSDRESEGCSCHLSAPCSFCTRDADEGDAPND